MKIYVLVPCSYSNATLEKKRLDRLFRTVKKAIDNRPKDVDIEVRVCGLYGNGETTAKYLKSTYGVITVPKGTGYPDNRRHLLLKSIKGRVREGDRFVFLDSDDMVSSDFFSNTDYSCPEKIWRSQRSSVVASEDGTLAVKIPKGNYADALMRNCTFEPILPTSKRANIDRILTGRFGGQIWGNFFPINMLDTVYNTLQYISMWEDVRFWIELPDYEVQPIDGTYYWVRNNSESICSGISNDKRNFKFATNVQAIIWALQDMELDPDSYPLVKAAKAHLNNTSSVGSVREYPYTPSDRRIVGIDDKLHTIPCVEDYIQYGVSDCSWHQDENELTYLMDFLNCIVL